MRGVHDERSVICLSQHNLWGHIQKDDDGPYRLSKRPLPKHYRRNPG